MAGELVRRAIARAGGQLSDQDRLAVAAKHAGGQLSDKDRAVVKERIPSAAELAMEEFESAKDPATKFAALQDLLEAAELARSGGGGLDVEMGTPEITTPQFDVSPSEPVVRRFRESPGGVVLETPALFPHGEAPRARPDLAEQMEPPEEALRLGLHPRSASAKPQR